MRNPFYPMPVYVTRKNANGKVATYTIGLVFALSIQFLAMLNAIVWGIIGLVAAAQLVF